MKKENFVIFSWNQIDWIKPYISIHKINFREINSKVIIKQATSYLTFYSWSKNSRNFDFWIYAYKKNKGKKITCHIASIARIFLQIGEFHHYDKIVNYYSKIKILASIILSKYDI